MNNSLVAARVDTTSPLAGAGLLEDGYDLVNAVNDRSWLDGTLAGVSAVVDTVAAVSDPIGSLLSAGLGWLIDHLSPLNQWLEDLTGDADQVRAFAQTWSNISGQLDGAAQELSGKVAADLADIRGQAADTYRSLMNDAGGHIEAASGWASGISAAFAIAAEIVQVVHDLVRDALADLVGAIISWVAELAFTFGLATPLVVEQVATRVASLATQLGTNITSLLRSLKNLGSLLESLKTLFKRAKDIFDDLLHGGPGSRSPESNPDGPGGSSPDGPGANVPGHTRTGDTTPSDGSGLEPGESHTTARNYEINPPTAEQLAQLDELASAPNSPIALVDGHYELREPVEVGFNVDRYFEGKDIDPDAIYANGITYREEYLRQLQMQQDGMNDLTIAEQRHNAQQYALPKEEGGGRMGDDRAARLDAGGRPGEAILHGPDQVAGGRPDLYDGLGHSGINSSIGRQWKDLTPALREDILLQSRGIPEDLLPFVHLNVQLVPN